MIDDEFIWHKKAWEEYKDWIKEKNISIVSKIIELIEDIIRTGLLKGLGKPERLKHYKKAVYSRRITDEHRLVYDVKDDRPRILSCKGHYEKKNFNEY